MLRGTVCATVVLCTIPASFASAAIDEGEVLAAIDSICGDTWCEGDFGFRFQSVSFADDTATVRFDYSLYSEHDDEEWFAAECALPGFASPEAAAQRRGQWVSLRDEFYSALSDCIQQVTDGGRARLEVGVLTADVRLAVCQAVFNQHFAYGYADEQLTATCDRMSIGLASVRPARYEISLHGRIDGTGHACQLALDRAGGALQILECSTWAQ
jgi:hypothetical protein